MDNLTVAKLLQRALDYAILHYGKSACKNGLCMVVKEMGTKGYFKKEERSTLYLVIDELLAEWHHRCELKDTGFSYLWVGIHKCRGISSLTAEIFPLWCQAYEDKIKELKTGVRHG